MRHQLLLINCFTTWNLIKPSCSPVHTGAFKVIPTTPASKRERQRVCMRETEREKEREKLERVRRRRIDVFARCNRSRKLQRALSHANSKLFFNTKNNLAKDRRGVTGVTGLARRFGKRTWLYLFSAKTQVNSAVPRKQIMVYETRIFAFLGIHTPTAPALKLCLVL